MCTTVVPEIILELTNPYCLVTLVAVVSQCSAGLCGGDELPWLAGRATRLCAMCNAPQSVTVSLMYVLCCAFIRVFSY